VIQVDGGLQAKKKKKSWQKMLGAFLSLAAQFIPLTVATKKAMQLRTRLSDLIRFRRSETGRQRDADSAICEVSERCGVMVSAPVMGKESLGSDLTNWISGLETP
jgi:hypothetical protein